MMFMFKKTWSLSNQVVLLKRLGELLEKATLFYKH